MGPDGREEVEQVTRPLLLQLVVQETDQLGLTVNVHLGHHPSQEVQHRLIAGVERHLEKELYIYYLGINLSRRY